MDMIGQEPAITQSDPEAYYLWLQTQRVPPLQATQMVQQRFGAPKSPQQLAKEKASAEQKSGLAQIGGQVAGVALGAEAMGGFKNIRGLFDNKPTYTTSPSIATPKVLNVEGSNATVQMPTGGTQQVPAEALNDPGFWSTVNWGQVAQGGLALAQMYNAYKSFKGGNKVGGAINMAAGAGNLAAATGAVATGAAAGTTGTYIIPGLNILAGAYGGYETAKMIGDSAAGSQRNRNAALGGATAGAAIGSAIAPGVGTAIGAAVGGLAGAVGSWTGSKKGKAQFMRDNIRNVLQQNNVLDQNFQGTLADGSKYDFGVDGKALKWKEIDKVAETNPNSWKAVVPLTDALATAYGFVGQRASDISAWYGKAAVSNAKDDPTTAIANAKHFAQQQGITFDMIKGKLDEAIKDNRISQSQYDYYLGGAQQLQGPIEQQAPVRAKPGEVVRQSPGMYRNDQGELIKAKTMREALQRSYDKTKEK
jgi:hypothetical protein